MLSAIHIESEQLNIAMEMHLSLKLVENISSTISTKVNCIVKMDENCKMDKLKKG